MSAVAGRESVGSTDPRSAITSFTEGSIREALGVDNLVGRLRGVKALTAQATREYAERFLFELVQNAFDAQDRDGSGRIRIVLDQCEGDHGCLYVANTGHPFAEADFRAICEIAQSSKPPGEGIGNKGIGFKSVLQVTDWPEVYSASADQPAGDAFGGYCFGFARPDDVLRLVDGDERAAAMVHDRLSPYGLPVPLDAQNEVVRGLAAAGFSSVIRLPIAGPQAREVVVQQVERLLEDRPPLLLFLDRLAGLEVRVVDAGGVERASALARTVTCVARDDDGIAIDEVDLGAGGVWLVASRAIGHEALLEAIRASVDAKLVSEDWLAWRGDGRVDVAIPVGGPGEAGRLYCYLPMGADAVAPLPGHVNAPFAVNLSRNGLTTGAPLNEFLLDRAASVAAHAALRLRDHPAGRTVVPDLVSWSAGHTGRIAAAFEATGAPLATAPVLPSLPDGWGSFATTRRWEPHRRTLTPERVAGVSDAPVLDPALGPARWDRLDVVAGALRVAMRPSLEVVAGWAEAVARSMAGEARASATAFDPEPWLDLYDELADIFGRQDADALKGRELLIDEDLRLHRTWGGAGGEAAAIFFPQREIGDEDDRPDVRVPQTLGRFLAYTHPALVWKARNEATGQLENRPGREFLDRARLVRLPRTQDILERLARVLADRTDKRLHGDALRLVYNLTHGRSHAQEPGLDRLHLRVPTTSGPWLPAGEVRFSSEWPGTLGGDLARLVTQAAGASAELAAIGDRLLAPPAELGIKPERLADWVAFLRRIGVLDGLWPLPAPLDPGVELGARWNGGHVALTRGLPAPEAAIWSRALREAASRAHYAFTNYRVRGAVWRLPAMGDHAALPHAARETYGRLVARGLAAWPPSVLVTEVYRPSRPERLADPTSFPSPVDAFLRAAPWVPVTRPREPGRVDLVTPADVWYHRDEDAEANPLFMPLVAPDVRRAIDASTALQSRLTRLGLHVWGEPGESMARLRTLAAIARAGEVHDSLLPNFRKAVERSWALAARAGAGAGLPLGPDDSVVVSRRGRVGTYPLDGTSPDPLHVLVDEDRLAAMVLDTLEVPVLRADPREGSAALAMLRPSLGDLVVGVGASDLRVAVDGVDIDDRVGERLVAPGREWLIDVVALTLEFRASAFNRQAEHRIREAVEVLRQVELHRGASVDVVLGGAPVDLPGHVQRVFAIADDASPAIAFEGAPGELDWATLLRLAPRIGDLLGVAETANALQTVIGSLGRRLGPDGLAEPTDSDYSDVLEESVEHVAQVRRGHRGLVAELLYLLRPVVMAMLGEDVVGRLAASSGEPVDRHGLAAALEPHAGSLPVGLTVDAMIETASSLATLADARDAFGIPFPDFNAALYALAPDYEPIHDAEAHANAFASHLASDQAIVGRLRAWALPAFDAGEVPEAYAAALRELGRARHRQARGPDDRAPELAPDPAWLDVAEVPTAEMMRGAVEAWLVALGVPPAPTTADLGPVDEVRQMNSRAVGRLGASARRLLPVWSAKLREAPLPAWVRSDSTAVTDALGAMGLLDFRPLDEPLVIGWLVVAGLWDPSLPRSLDMAALGLTPDDLAAQERAEDRARWERQQARRGIAFDGVPRTLDATEFPALVDAIDASLTAELLATPRREVALEPMAKQSPTRRGRERGEGDPTSGRTGDERAPSRLTSDQTELIGVVGELVAYRWLERAYGVGPDAWRSRSRRVLFADGDPGDDGLGYDFEVLRGRQRLLFEVKATTTDATGFDMSDKELRVAQSLRRHERYQIVFVGRVNDSAARWLAVLPNPLLGGSRDLYRMVGRGIRYEFRATEGTPDFLRRGRAVAPDGGRPTP